MTAIRWGRSGLLAVAIATCGWAALAQAPDAQQRAAALKESIEKSRAQLKQYEWIETTTVSFKGEEKSRTQKQCYYGVDGKVQKVEVSTTKDEGRQPRGLRGKIVENKKEQLTDYMQRAVALVHEYVPPDPARIQKAASTMSIQMAGSGQPVKLQFRDYLKPGDLFETGVDMTTNELRGVAVKSYLDTREDVVSLDVRMGELPGSISYAQRIVLDAHAKSIQVTVENSGHRQR